MPTKCRVIVALLAIALLPATETIAQQQGYQTPNFAGMAMQAGGGAQQIPTAFPASPLAGGPAAATQGGEYMDVYGQPIVMQANYCQSCPDGSGGMGYCGPGGYGGGDPMAVDFGGYGQDQVGPHYFDVSVDTVFLQVTEVFDDVGPLATVTALGTDRILNPANSDDNYDAGWQIAARYDIGALAVLEATYMGLYDIGFTETADEADAIFTSFGGFGFAPIDGIDFSDRLSLDYQSDLQSTEISYRRYWVGNNPRVSGTWLMGARYLRMTEDFNMNSRAEVSVLIDPSQIFNGNRLWSSENDMVGFQFGGDGWLGLRQGLRIGGEAKSGIYNNHFKFRHAATLPSGASFNSLTEGDQIAFAAEGGVTMVADVLPSLSIRGGYRVLYLNSLVTAGNNIDTTNILSTAVSSQAHALYHGFHGGIEYIW